jgi:hypothetical protein
MSKYCITASTDKDQVVNEGENNGRTEMQSHDVLPPFWFSFTVSEDETKLLP